MKRTVTTILYIIALALTVRAQAPAVNKISAPGAQLAPSGLPKDTAPSTFSDSPIHKNLPALTPEQQGQVSQALQAQADAHKAADLADTRLAALIFRVMAVLGVNPDQYKPVLDAQGGMHFEPIVAPPPPSGK
jgi:hypothetical protein